MSFHKKEIPQGVLGETSKILEEVLEMIDAEEQGIKSMTLFEASDALGAMILWLEKNHPSFQIEDLILFAKKRITVARAKPRT